MAGAKPVRFLYDAEVTIREVEQMRPIEELAYRRVLDLIVVCRNRLINDDVELARMTKCGEAWPQIKQRLIEDHRLLYVLNGYIRNVRCDEALIAVERSIHQKRMAGRASAAKRKAKKDTALHQPPPPVETAPRQVLPDPPAIGVEVPAPVVPVNGGGAVDGTMRPEQAGATIPQDWRPNPEGVTFAVARGFAEPQIEGLVRGYVANCRDKGIVSKDPDAGFKVWVLRDLAQSPLGRLPECLNNGLGKAAVSCP